MPEEIDSISIPRYSQSNPVQYTVLLSGPVRSYTITTRYSSLYELHQKLLALYPCNRSFPSSWTMWTTETFLEKRRKELEEYLQGIMKDKDATWRNSVEWRRFFNIPLNPPSTIQMTSRTWLDEYDTVKSAYITCKVGISEAKSRNELLEAQFAAKRCIKESIPVLEKLSRWIQEENELSRGEIGRRRDLLTELNGIKDDLIKQASHTPSSPKPPSPQKDRDLLIPKSSRKFGVIQDTDETRDLDNAGLLQQQTTMMKQQDDQLDAFTGILARQKLIAQHMNDELQLQNQLLDEFGQDLDNTEGKMKGASKRLNKVTGK